MSDVFSNFYIHIKTFVYVNRNTDSCHLRHPPHSSRDRSSDTTITYNSTKRRSKMRDFEVIETLRQILYGVNPVTAEKLSSHDVIMHPTIQEALQHALELCVSESDRKYFQWNFRRSNMRWSEQEDIELNHDYKFGCSINVIAIMHHRSERAIRDRLIHLGFEPYNGVNLEDIEECEAE